jgi:hypothetical protein
MTRWSVLLFGTMVACAKSSAGEAPAPPETSAAPAPPEPRAAASASSSPAAAAGTTSWKGSYKSVAATITLPRDVKWKVPDSTEGIGEGTIALTVEHPGGRVRGTIDGVLGPATVDGQTADGKLTAKVSRQDPSDHGFTGTLSGDVGDGSAHGTMNVAQADVSAVRSATFELSPSRAAEPGH